jgi:hypothetical protein
LTFEIEIGVEMWMSDLPSYITTPKMTCSRLV